MQQRQLDGWGCVIQTEVNELDDAHLVDVIAFAYDYWCKRDTVNCQKSND